jgi:hypothetical protein
VKTKRNLTKSEQRADFANAKRLKLAGLAIGVEDAASSEAPLLRIEQSEYSFVYAGALGGMALAICLRVKPSKSGITLFEDVEFSIPGCEGANFFLAQPAEGSLRYKAFGWLDFQGDSVLNHRILNGRSLPLDRNLDGILLAQSFDPLPSQFQSGMLIPAKIHFADLSEENVFTSDLRLGVERCEQSVVRPEKWPIRAGASYRHSSLAQDQELTGENSKPISGIASVNK